MASFPDDFKRQSSAPDSWVACSNPGGLGLGQWLCPLVPWGQSLTGLEESRYSQEMTRGHMYRCCHGDSENIRGGRYSGIVCFRWGHSSKGCHGQRVVWSGAFWWETLQARSVPVLRGGSLGRKWSTKLSLKIICVQMLWNLKWKNRFPYSDGFKHT